MSNDPSMSNKLRWGILSTASIGTKKGVVAAMQQGEHSTVAAIASRSIEKAREAAATLGIPTAYGSYEELLADPAVDAVYNPLPNHLHVPWTIKAAEAGKHVLCEKPLALTAADAESLIAVRERTGVKIGEAFMVRSHPQWIRLRELIEQGRIGELRAMYGDFSYFNINPENIRNNAEIGGGALMDIGCYLVHAARYAFHAQPERVVSLISRDPVMHTDRLTSAMLDFGNSGDDARQAIFTCSTQLVPHQRLQFFGTKGRIEVEVPVNAAAERPARLLIDDGTDLYGTGLTVETFPLVNQYTLQADAFARAVFGQGEVPVPIEDSVLNLAVMEAVFRSAESGSWESTTRA